MATQKQIAANRRNARRSTGPQTPEGKAVASGNSLQHGLLAKSAVLSEECRQAFLDTLTALQAEHQPVGLVEAFLVRQMATAQWRLDRMNRVETGLLTSHLETARTLESHDRWDDEDEDEDEDDGGDYEQIDEDQQEASAHQQEAGQSEPPLEDGPQEEDFDETTRLLGRSFIHDSACGDTFSKLARYETMIRRAFYKAFSALVSAQARRNGQPPPRLAP